MLYGYAKSYNGMPTVDELMQSFLEMGIPPNCVFIDRVVSNNKKRPAYDLLRLKLLRSDILYLYALDDLGTNLLEASNTWEDITHTLGADIVVLGYEGILDSRAFRITTATDGLTTDTLFLSLLRYLETLRRQRMRSRQMKGYEVAKSKGVRLGRPRYEVTLEQRQIADAWRRGELKGRDAIRLSGLPKTTFYALFRKTKLDRFTSIQSPDNIEEDPR